MKSNIVKISAILLLIVSMGATGCEEQTGPAPVDPVKSEEAAPKFIEPLF